MAGMTCAEHAHPDFIEQVSDEGKRAKTRLDWPSEIKDEVLARLLALNAARAEAERAADPTATDEDDDEETSNEGGSGMTEAKNGRDR